MKNPSPPLQRFARALVRTAVILMLVLGALGALFYVSFHAVLQAAHASLASHPNPAADYAQAIACGLGQKVYVAGLSAGGTLSAWVVQNRAEVARAVLIAPALGFVRHEGTRLQKAFALFLPMLPDIRTDWFSVDPECPPYQYPGFSSRALGQLLRVSLAIYAGALEGPPRVQDVTLVTSQSDQTVNDLIAWQLLGLWRAKGLRELSCVDFPRR
jgi:pimeloyl-ACP methyl ester carboxylesterase